MVRTIYVGFLITIFLSTSSCSRDIERDITIRIKPGTEECFYQDILVDETLDIEYQVIDGSHGDLDINFYVIGPSRRVLIQDYKKSDNTHRTTISEAGDYKICWDNNISRVNTKTVYFSLMVQGDDEEDSNDDAIWGRNYDSSYTADDIYEMKIEDIKEGIDRIRVRLTKSQDVQDHLRTFEARDRNLVEHNFSRVNTWSLLNVIVMLSTGLIQVVLLRSLFDEKSRLNKLWKNENSSKVYS